MYVLGVDGCRGGWLIAHLALMRQSVTFSFSPTFADLLTDHQGAACIAVDIPIGLMEGVSRECDRQARQLLKSRHSTVFPAPDARLICEPNFEAARARAREIECTGISQQAAAILPKIREVNLALNPGDQSRIIEVHPELGFWALNGKIPVLSSKKKVVGFDERHALLTVAGLVFSDRKGLRALNLPAKPDDFLDAAVAAWIARKHFQKTEQRLPTISQVGLNRLKAEIVY